MLEKTCRRFVQAYVDNGSGVLLNIRFAHRLGIQNGGIIRGLVIGQGSRGGPPLVYGSMREAQPRI